MPVYQTSTFEQECIGKHKGFEYSRTGNPTRKVLEDALASLEFGKYSLAFASGSAATTAVLHTLKAGDHVVAGDDIYGGTYRLFEKVFKPWGLSVSYADVEDTGSFERAIQENTRLIWVETPTNPLLKIVDLRGLARLAARENILLAVDNTFATPYLQSPLALGADIVVHSTTKYLAGHSDLVGGALVISRDDLYRDLKYYQNAAGAIPGPWDCWLVLRGLKTLALRMREHERNAGAIAAYLEEHPKVESVFYPGLPDFPGHDLAKSQMTGFGGMLSIELAGGLPAVERFLAGLKLFLLAESLGGVESLVCYPCRMTHGVFPPKEREFKGIKDNLLRLSVGIEHVDDLLEDLEQALRIS